MKYTDEGLHCPHCDFNYLHHDRVEVFDRCGAEDVLDGVHVTVTGNAAFFDTSMKNNPSRRRDGIRIEFYCEGCDKRSELLIAQHKGITYIDHLTIPMIGESICPKT